MVAQMQTKMENGFDLSDYDERTFHQTFGDLDN